jgi:4-hydroxybenzoate polyprenyltransferase
MWLGLRRLCSLLMKWPPITPRQLLEVARPGLWPTQLWFYLLPLGGRRLLDEAGFWWGAIYVTFPLGLLLYGWNDWADYETDRFNPRKGNLLFGARLPREALAQLPWMISLVQIPFLIAFFALIGAQFVWWVVGAALVVGCYNAPALDFKARPLLDVLAQSGYLLVFVLASWVNEVPMLAPPVLLLGVLFAMHSHLVAEMADIEPDRVAGRRTTAVVLGTRRTKWVVGIMLIVEGAIVAFAIDSSGVASGNQGVYWWVGAFLAIAGVGGMVDAMWRKEAPFTPQQLAGVLMAWNVVAIASMVYVWRSGLFVS